MALAAPAFVPNNRHERIWKTISNQLFLNRGFTASPSQCRRKWYSLKYGIVDFILVVILGIVDPILTIIIHRIVDYVPVIIQEIIDPVLEDTERGHILYERE
ncbi:14629_t:CDS:2, partial [Funneliformis geosporum]